MEAPLPPIILASASPRRKELLSGLLERFEIVVSGVDEEALGAADPWATARLLAEAKANDVARRRPEAIVIGADTVVALPSGEERSDWLQLAKPADRDHAYEMLRSLSNRAHWVITAVTIRHPAGTRCLDDAALVTFRELGAQEIRDYVATGEPMDKAGAYAIQGGAKGFVARLDGNLSTVVGLPVEKLREAFLTIGIPVRNP